MSEKPPIRAVWKLLSLAALAAVLAGCETTEVRQSPSARAPAAAPAPRVASAPPGNPFVWPESAPAIFARSAILIDANTGAVLYQKNADERRQVASTQKLLTGLLVAEAGNLEHSVRIDASDTRVEPTKLSVRPGQTYSRRELLTAIMVKSCNDAAAALARDYAGSTTSFASLMNLRARQLGAESSYFANPHGLPAAQFSTARDMARIAFRAYRQPDLRSMMQLPSYRFTMADGRSKYLDATNKLLARSSIFNGMKTGYTDAAGRCLVTSASYNGRNLILVQLGSQTRYIFNDAERLIQWGLNRNSPFLAGYKGGRTTDEG